MVSQPLKARLPSTEELPCSDDTPVDNVGQRPSRSEDQNLLPNLLLFALTLLWSERADWYFGVDMAVYHTTGANPRVPVVPDAFLSLGVERRKGGKSRRSYATWEENDIVPILVLEMVSHQANSEYDEKLALYAQLDVLYYVIYNPEFWQRDRHQPFEVYKLAGQTYQLQMGEPYWMPEIGLGIGRDRQLLGNVEQEVLRWHDEQGNPYPLPDEVIREMRTQLRAERLRTALAEERAEAERQRANRLAQRLRELGIDPEQI